MTLTDATDRHSATRPARRRIGASLLALGLSVGLMSCTASSPFWAADDHDPSPLGPYLAGIWANAQSAPADAAHYYRRALERDPGNAMLAAEAFRASLMAADWTGAAPMAEAVLADDPGNHEARLALAVDSMARGRHRAAVRLLEDAPLGPLDRIAGSLLLGWSLAATGDAEAGAAALSRSGDGALFASLVELHRAMLRDRLDDAPSGTRLREALQEYDLPDPRGAPNAAASLAMYGAALELMGRDFSNRSLVYLILAARLDESFAPPRMMLAQIMASQGRDDEASAMFASIADDPMMGVEARIRLAHLETSRGDPEAAEAMLRALWEQDGAEEAARALADTLRVTRQWAEAETLLHQLITARESAGLEADWRLLYGRAVARERLGDWPRAEADFRAAIDLNPSDASLLNYLGYSLIDRGLNLEEGLDLIRRAIALNPRAGYIIDSLGWAYYKLGDYQEAVTHLERAAALEPGEADINDHLGDAYWRVGRELEARFQWERTLGLEPDEAMRAEIERKLAYGLAPPGEPPSMAEAR